MSLIAESLIGQTVLISKTVGKARGEVVNADDVGIMIRWQKDGALYFHPWFSILHVEVDEAPREGAAVLQ